MFITLQVILKVAERCNLACTYCYYFFAGDESYSTRPPLMKEGTAEQVADFLATASVEMAIPNILIAFHGGEPTLLKPAKFDELCTIFRARITASNLGFQMQTNGTLLSPDWIAVLRKHEVSVGVSLDGPAPQNDKFRIDHAGKGSHASVVEGIRALQAAAREDANFHPPGAIAVVNPTFDYERVFRHLHIELGIDQVSFLLPDVSHDKALPFGIGARRYGEILCEIFDAWIATGAKAQVRQIERFLSYFQQIDESTIPLDLSSSGCTRTQIVVIQSNGELSIDDSYMVALEWRQAQQTPPVSEITLREYLAQPVFDDIDRYRTTLPTKCESCCWSRVCGGGDLENRYSKAAFFDNPSVFCEGLKLFYAHASNHLIANGYPREELIARVLGREAPAEAVVA